MTGASSAAADRSDSGASAPVALGSAAGDAATFDRDEILDALAPIIAAQVAARDTPHAVFHGCVDWHSAVHGHWALLRIARATGRHEERARAVDHALRPEGIAEEAAFLQQHADFELPYGRAWFLLLAEEFERWGGERAIADPARLRAMAAEVAASLDRYMDACECAEGIDACIGEYRNPSWALLRLHGWYAFVGDAHGQARTAARAAGMQAPEPTGDAGFGADLRGCEFFSPFGNYATLLGATRPEAAADLLGAHPLADDALAPIVALPSTAHGLGMNWSRAWSLRALAEAATEDQQPRLRAAYAAHVAQAWEHHALKAGDVWAYDHWVPQFAVYALTEPLGTR